MAPSTTSEKVCYFSSRKMSARLKTKLRLIAIQRSDLEGRNVSMEEVHNEVLKLGMPLAEEAVRTARAKAS